MKIKDLARFYGITPRTVDNYIRDLKDKTVGGFIPKTGRHNILRAMLVYYYLTEYGVVPNEEPDIDVYYNNIEMLLNTDDMKEVRDIGQTLDRLAILTIEDKKTFLLK